MQKAFVIFTIFIICFKVCSQQMGYHPVFIDQCTGKISVEFISLYSADNSYYSDNTETDTITVPKPGIYFTSVLSEATPNNRIEIFENKIIHDTLYGEKITLSVCICNPPFSEYLDCGNKAEGRITDYYFNGRIRQEGTFKNGQLTDTLKTYYSTGEIQETFYKRKKRWQAVKYYKNGKIMSNKGYLHGSYKEYEYYENGNLKTKFTRKRTFRYSENGILQDEDK